MAKFSIKETTTVGELKQQFVDQIGGTLRIYDGRSQADDDATLVSLGAKTGNLECRSSRTVGKFEEAFQVELNAKVKVYTADDWVQVLSGVTLESVAKIKRQARKADMEQYVAYQRVGESTNTSATSTANNDLEQYKGIPIIEIKYRDFGRKWQEELKKIDEDDMASYPAIGVLYYNYGDNAIVVVDQGTVSEVASALQEFCDDHVSDQYEIDGIYFASELNGYGADVEELGGVIGCALNEFFDGGNKHTYAYEWDDWFGDKVIFIDDYGRSFMAFSDGGIDMLDLTEEQIDQLKNQFDE